MLKGQRGTKDFRIVTDKQIQGNKQAGSLRYRLVHSWLVEIQAINCLPIIMVGQPSPVDIMIFPYSKGIRNFVMTSGDACHTCVPMEQKERLHEIPNQNKSEKHQKLGSVNISPKILYKAEYEAS